MSRRPGAVADPGAVRLGESAAALRLPDTTTFVTVSILGRAPWHDGRTAIYCDRLVHTARDTHVGDYELAGTVVTVLLASDALSHEPARADPAAR